jgi:hypothetical protein
MDTKNDHFRTTRHGRTKSRVVAAFALSYLGAAGCELGPDALGLLDVVAMGLLLAWGLLDGVALGHTQDILKLEAIV